MGTELAGFAVACAAHVEAHGIEDLDVLVLGVGKTAAAVSLLQLLRDRSVAGLLLFGVAGAFPARHRALRPLVRVGDVCVVSDDVFGDEGVLTASGFQGIGAMGLGEVGPYPMAGDRVAAAAHQLNAPVVRGVTVSTCSGTEDASARLSLRSGADVETMEGAAVAFACRRLRLPLLQVRAISNWTGERSRGEWDLATAVPRVQLAVRRLIAG